MAPWLRYVLIVVFGVAGFFLIGYAKKRVMDIITRRE